MLKILFLDLICLMGILLLYGMVYILVRVS